MPKISRYKLEKDFERLILRQLAETFGEVIKGAEMDLLMDNLFTKSEKIMLAKRLTIAILLDRGWDYAKISQRLKVSPTTISFVKNSKFNSSPAYENLIKNLDKVDFV